MSSTQDKIAEIEAEMAKTQKNKATNFHLGVLKGKLAKLRAEILAQNTASSGGAGEGYAVAKTGDASIGLVGFPSVGKSSIMNWLTGQKSEVASYEFTTLTCIPGVVEYRGAKLQILDLPGIIEGAKDGKGRGKQVIAVAYNCNALLIVLDGTQPLGMKNKIEAELFAIGIRLNRDPPDITITKKDKGGLAVIVDPGTTLTHIDPDLVVALCKRK